LNEALNSQNRCSETRAQLASQGSGLYPERQEMKAQNKETNEDKTKPQDKKTKPQKIKQYK